MRTALFFALSLSLAACGDKASEPSGPAPKASATPAAHASAHASAAAPAGKPAHVAYVAPAGWTAGPARPMRMATLTIPKAAGDAEDGELSISQAGGSVDANVQRWEHQFTGGPAVKRSEKTVNGVHVTLVELAGTYAGMSMGGSSAPKPGYAMLAAIVDTQVPTFFKLTGPEKTVAGAHGEFDKLIDGLTAK